MRPDIKFESPRTEAARGAVPTTEKPPSLPIRAIRVIRGPVTKTNFFLRKSARFCATTKAHATSEVYAKCTIGVRRCTSGARLVHDWLSKEHVSVRPSEPLVLEICHSFVICALVICHSRHRAPKEARFAPKIFFSTQKGSRSEPIVANQRSTSEPEVSQSEPEVSSSEPEVSSCELWLTSAEPDHCAPILPQPNFTSDLKSTHSAAGTTGFQPLTAGTQPGRSRDTAGISRPSRRDIFVLLFMPAECLWPAKTQSSVLNIRTRPVHRVPLHVNTATVSSRPCERGPK